MPNPEVNPKDAGMSRERSREIAFKIAKHKIARLGGTLHAMLRSDKSDKELADLLDIELDRLVNFRTFMIFSIAADACNELKVVNVPQIYQERMEEVAFKFIVEHGVDLIYPHKNAAKHLESLHESTSVPLDELRQFYAQFVLPHAIKIAMGWNVCSIIGGNVTKA